MLNATVILKRNLDLLYLITNNVEKLIIVMVNIIMACGSTLHAIIIMFCSCSERSSVK